MSAHTLAYLLFWVLAAAIVGGTVLMLVSKNFVHSAAYLAAVLLSFSGAYALQRATFLALLQLFIYAGAMTVIIVFVVMMTRVSVDSYRDLLQRQAWLAGIVAAAFAIPLIDAVASVSRTLRPVGLVRGGTIVLAEVLLRRYVVAFEVAGVILLAAMVGAIYLAKEAR